MESELVLVDREALLAELSRVFDAQTAETLLRVLDKVAAQVRAAGVTREDFGELKQLVAELVEAQRRTELQIAELAEAQRKAETRLAGVEDRLARVEDRLAGVEDRLAGVEDRLARVEDRLAGVEDHLSRLERVVEQLAEAQRRTTDTVGDLKGRVLEANYRDKAVAYFGRWLRRPQVVAMNHLWETLEAHLPEEDLDDVILLDLVVRGKPRKPPATGEVWLAVEVSAVVDEGDVARAGRRTALLRQAGYRAIPVVAGEQMTPGAEAEARRHKVAVLQDGRSSLWEEALEAWAMA